MFDFLYYPHNFPHISERWKTKSSDPRSRASLKSKSGRPSLELSYCNFSNVATTIDILFTTDCIKTVTEKNDPLRWEVFGPKATPKLEEYTAKAICDVWWTWPEAIAWMGSQNYQNIAFLRYWADWWQDAEGNQLAGQTNLAIRCCTLPQQVEARLLRALEAGTVKSSGRSKPEGKPALLEAGAWRGGAIIFLHGTTCLVSNRNLSSAPWAYDIAVNRADLVDYSGVGESIIVNDIGRAPSVKTGHPPSADRIRAKAIEMKARGLDGQAIAKTMRHEAGFETAGTVIVRDAIKGLWPPGRQKKPA